MKPAEATCATHTDSAKR